MRPVVVGGFAGTGKSTVGALAARALGVTFTDTDDVVAERSGAASAGEAFARLGEGAFRAMERDALRDAIERGGVIATGGGALTARSVRHEVLERATVITLEADAATILSRVRPGTRPLLDAPDAARRVEELLEARRDAYAEAHFHVRTTDRAPAEVAEAIVRRADDRSVVVPLGARTHRYRVVAGRPEALAEEIGALAPTGLVVVTDAAVHRARKAHLERALAAIEAPVLTTVVLPEGEVHKNAAAANVVWDAALGAGADRHAVVLAFGGGVVGDVAGFAAATLLRGVRWVQAPTTSLAMVDASIGGKTGFDHTTGKNLVGAVHQPSAIVADLAHLETLSPRHGVAGLAEVVKVGLATDASLLARATGAIDEALLYAAASAKIRVVRVDEFESGVRAVLNLGHTVGHALETHGRFERHLHGEAVALGLLAELDATTRLGLTAPDVPGAAREALGHLGLPTAIDRAFVEAALHHVWGDKKRVGRALSLPVVRAIGRWSLERMDVDTFLHALRG